MYKKLPLLLISSIVMLLSVFFSAHFYESDESLTSPLVGKEKIFGLNQWFPQQVLGIESNDLKITAKSALFIDVKSGEVLYSKNPQDRLPIASLVKVMTSVIALENRGLDEYVVVSERAASMEPDKMLLIAGEKLAIRELLYGLFLVSANDGAEVLAETVTGNREEFVKLMNNKAQFLGMKDTLFVNPTGLDEKSGNSYSTAYDLAVLTRYAIKTHPVLVEISQTPSVLWPKTENRQDYEMYSGINLLTSYKGVVGLKTGYTPNAGLTLITLAKRGEYEVIGVLLDSGNRRDEAKLLLDYSFKKLDPSQEN